MTFYQREGKMEERRTLSSSFSHFFFRRQTLSFVLYFSGAQRRCLFWPVSLRSLVNLPRKGPHVPRGRHEGKRPQREGPVLRGATGFIGGGLDRIYIFFSGGKMPFPDEPSSRLKRWFKPLAPVAKLTNCAHETRVQGRMHVARVHISARAAFRETRCARDGSTTPTTTVTFKSSPRCRPQTGTIDARSNP